MRDALYPASCLFAGCIGALARPKKPTTHVCGHLLKPATAVSTEASRHAPNSPHARPMPSEDKSLAPNIHLDLI